MDDNYVCKKCDKPIDDIAEVMVKGCDCGCRVFKQLKNMITATSERDPSTENDKVSIKVKETGVYNLNLKALIDRNSIDEPIFVEDAHGKINVVFNPDT